MGDDFGFDVDVDYGEDFIDYGEDSGTGQNELGDKPQDDFDLDGQGDDLVGNSQVLDESGGKQQLNKTVIFGIVAGIILIIISMLIVRGSKRNNVRQSNTVIDKTAVVSENSYNRGNSGGNQSLSSQSSDDWQRIDTSSSINWSQDYVSSSFQITNIEHYVRIVDISSNLEVKTVLTGTLAGFKGTYILELPYYIGCQLSMTNSFDVKVQVGDYQGKIVVGEIIY